MGTQYDIASHKALAFGILRKRSRPMEVSNETLFRVCVSFVPDPHADFHLRTVEGDGTECSRDFVYFGAQFPQGSRRRDSRRIGWCRDQFEGSHLRLLPEREHASVGVRQERNLYQGN